MITIVLSVADQERLGAPPKIPFDLTTLTNREAISLQELGYQSPRLFRKALQAKPIDDGGKQLSEEQDEVFSFDIDYKAWTVFLWLALRRCGVDVDVKNLEYDVENITLLSEDEDEPYAAPVPDDAGKAPEESKSLVPTS